MIGTSNRKKLFIVRRESGGIGGAEKVAHRFQKSFSKYFETELIHAGKKINGFSIKGTRGPSWLKCLSFAKSTREFLKDKPNALVLSMERGVPGDIYRAGDGVHKVWLKHKYRNSTKWTLNPLHWILPKLESISIEKSKLVVPNSNMVRDEILTYYNISNDRLKVIHNGCDIETFYPLSTDERCRLRKELGLNEAGLNLLFSGSGWDRKGLGFAIQMLGRINSLSIDAKLWIAGKGEKEKYQSLANSLNCEDKIRFIGPQKRINLWYQACDILVLPTSYDPFSNSCLEATACGMLVSTSIFNGAKECISASSKELMWENFGKNEIIRVADKIAYLNLQICKHLPAKHRFNKELEVKKYLELLT
jgi:UDP-glucose:(heptosyl)LPS alpha-1,3-glucosyltransferase